MKGMNETRGGRRQKYFWSHIGLFSFKNITMLKFCKGQNKKGTKSSALRYFRRLLFLCPGVKERRRRRRRRREDKSTQKLVSLFFSSRLFASSASLVREASLLSLGISRGHFLLLRFRRVIAKAEEEEGMKVLRFLHPTPPFAHSLSSEINVFVVLSLSPPLSSAPPPPPLPLPSPSYLPSFFVSPLSRSVSFSPPPSPSSRSNKCSSYSRLKPFPLPCSPSLLSTWANTKSSLREMGRKGGGWGEREAERENSNFQLREKGEKIRGVAPNGQEKRKEGKREGVSKKKGFYAHTVLSHSLLPSLPCSRSRSPLLPGSECHK